MATCLIPLYSPSPAACQVTLSVCPVLLSDTLQEAPLDDLTVISKSRKATLLSFKVFAGVLLQFFTMAAFSLFL